MLLRIYLAKKQKHTTEGIRWSSPTQLLVFRSPAYVWQSGRDAQFSCTRICVRGTRSSPIRFSRASRRLNLFLPLPSATELEPFRRFFWMLQPDIHKRPSGARCVLAVPTCVFRLPPQSPFLSVVPASLPFPLEPFYPNRSSRGSCSLLLRRAILLLALAVVVCVQHYDSSTWSFTSQR